MSFSYGLVHLLEDFHVALEAVAVYGHFAVVFFGELNQLLNAIDKRGKRRGDDTSPLIVGKSFLSFRNRTFRN